MDDTLGSPEDFRIPNSRHGGLKEHVILQGYYYCREGTNITKKFDGIKRTG